MGGTTGLNPTPFGCVKEPSGINCTVIGKRIPVTVFTKNTSEGFVCFSHHRIGYIKTVISEIL